MVCRTVAVVALEESAFAVEWIAAFAADGLLHLPLMVYCNCFEWADSSVAWAVASAVACDVYVAWAGVEMFAFVDAAAGLALAAMLGLAV